MPYIKEEDRNKLLVIGPTTAGELNYAITNMCIKYLARYNEGYAKYNEVIGALECAKLELYRRAIVPYENEKITENGDVY